MNTTLLQQNKPFSATTRLTGKTLTCVFNQMLLALFLLITLCAARAFGQAPTISYSSPQVYTAGTAISPLTPTSSGVAGQAYSATPVIIGSGFSSPANVAVDAAGNVYVADYGNNAIKEIPAGNGTPVIIGSGFNGPTGVAVDAAGNVYVADTHNAAVKEIPAGNGTPVILGSGFSSPVSVAVDAAGNVYVADSGKGKVYEIPAGNGVPVILGSGFTTPTGVAVDAAGNVYVADDGNGVVEEIPAGNGAPVMLGSGFFGPIGVAVDGGGNVYVADFNSFAVKEIPAGNGTLVTLGSGYNKPHGVATDAAGNVYIADYGHNAVKELTPIGGYYAGLPAGLFINSNTGVISGIPTTASAATNYTVTAYNGLSATATVNIAVVLALPTTPATNVSFTNTITTTTTISWTNGNGTSRAVFMAAASSGSPAPVNFMAYSPNAAFGNGAQIGTTGWYCVYNGTGSTVNVSGLSGGTTYQAMVVEYNGTGNGVAYLTTPGTGNPAGVTTLPPFSYTGPQIYTIGTAVTPLTPNNSGTVTQAYNATLVNFASGFNNPRGLAADAAGNIYEVEYNGTVVTKIPAGGGAPVTFASGFVGLSGVAVDAAGNVYVVVTGSSGVVTKILAGGGSQVTIGSGFNGLYGIAVDAAGNVYVSEQSTNTVKKIPVGGGAPVIIGSGFYMPYGVAVDAAGNVYVDDEGRFVVKEIPVGGGAPVTLASGFEAPTSIAVDAAGNVYVDDYFNIDELPPGGGKPVIIVAATGFESYVMAMDAAGNIYFGENGGGIIKKVLPIGGYYTSRFLPAGLIINSSTGVISGTPTAVTAAANYTVTAYYSAGLSAAAVVNIGVAPLPPTIPATSLVFTGTTSKATTASWTNGNGTSRAVFMAAASGGSPAPVNLTAYNANAAFGQGDQIGSTGWYCVYNGTGSTVNVTGLAAGTTYQAMVVEYSSTGSAVAYLTTPGTGNPLSVTTIPPIALIAITTTSTNPTNTNSIQYTATFAASISNLSIANFSLSTTGSVSGASINAVSGSGTTWTITINTGNGDGTILLSMNNTTGDPESISNLPFAAATNTIDKTQPAVSIGAPSVTYANSGATVNYTVTWSDANLNSSSVNLSAAQVISNTTITRTASIGNTSVSAISGNSATVSFSNVTGDGTVAFSVPAGTALDNAGNSALASSLSTAFTADNTAPTATISGPSVMQTGNTASAAVTYTVTYADANFNYSNLTGSGITLNTISGTATGNVGVSGGGTSYTVTISSLTGVGTLGITLAGGYAFDFAGNTDAGAGPSATFNVLNSDVTLANLTANPGTLTPSFSPGVTAYADSLGHTITNITVTPTTTDPNATAVVAINGSAAPGGSGPINVGDNNVVVTVTAADGVTTGTYSVRVGRQGSHLAGLANLSVSGAAISPSFTTAKTGYTASVPYTTKSVTVTPSVIDVTSTVTVNGVAVNNKTASGAIALNAGSNILTVVVTAQDGITTQTYTVNITRATNTNAYLANLSLSNGAALSPAFSVSNMSYTTSVGTNVSSLTVTPTLSDPNATIMVNGKPVTNKTASGTVALNIGSSTAITIVVTAQDGVTTQTYTILVSSVVSSNANLAGLTISKGSLSPAFTAATTGYNVAEVNTVSSITVKPTVANAFALVTINGATAASGVASTVNLNYGANTVTLLVTAQNGAQQTYTLTITRALSTDAYLSSISMFGTAISPAFVKTTNGYTASVANKVTSVTLTANVLDATAMFTVNGAPGTPKVASSPIMLSVGSNTITIIVTAQDGVTTETYTVTVTRAMGSVNTVFQPVGVGVQNFEPLTFDDGINVHQGVSPNGDGVNDFLQIDNISQYPDNKLSIMNRNGQLIYEATGYDNSSKVFDGHSNKNGQLQQPGTYFYQLDYAVNGITKHKTGFIVLKY